VTWDITFMILLKNGLWTIIDVVVEKPKGAVRNEAGFQVRYVIVIVSTLQKESFSFTHDDFDGC